MALGEKPAFPPGTSYRYSNTNYLLAGLIIRAVTGNNLVSEIYRALYGGRPLAPAQQRALGTTVPEPDGPASAGLGVFRMTLSCPNGDAVPVWERCTGSADHPEHRRLRRHAGRAVPAIRRPDR